VLCTTFSCSSSLTVTMTVVRVTERRAPPVSVAPAGLRLVWRLVRATLRAVAPASTVAGTSRPESPDDASRDAAVRRDDSAADSLALRLMLPPSRWVC